MTFHQHKEKAWIAENADGSKNKVTWCVICWDRLNEEPWEQERTGE